MTCLHFDIHSHWYSKALELRRSVLREPLGLRLSATDRKDDHHSHHFAVLEHGKMVACLIAIPQTTNQVRLRQMAVLPEHQSKGLGRELLQFAERCLLGHGVERIELHARTTAVEFYQKQGYRIEGEEFMEQTIAHIKMSKNLK